MSEQSTLHEGQRPPKGSPDLQALAKEFDRLSSDHSYVIPPHQERPEAFKWFVAGVMYERARASHDQPS